MVKLLKLVFTLTAEGFQNFDGFSFLDVDVKNKRRCRCVIACSSAEKILFC